MPHSTVCLAVDCVALEKHEEGDEMKLFLELPPELHLKILSVLVMYVSSSAMLRQSADARLSEAKHLESAITKVSFILSDLCQSEDMHFARCEEK